MEEKSREQELSVREISLIRELTQIRKEHKRELEYEKFDGYELPPRTQFSMLIISLREGMKLRKTQLSYRLKKMNGNVRKDGKIWNTGVALLKYFAGLNSNQNGQYGQIYAEKFTSACLICKVFYGKMKAQ